MSYNELLAAVLTPLVAFGLKYLLGLIGFQLDEQVFVSLVAAIVSALVGLFFVQVAKSRGVRGLR